MKHPPWLAQSGQDAHIQFLFIHFVADFLDFVDHVIFIHRKPERRRPAASHGSVQLRNKPARVLRGRAFNSITSKGIAERSSAGEPLAMTLP